MNQQNTRIPYNVVESYPLYDTVIVCPEFYGTEGQNRGWFTTFAAFAGQEQHRFLNQRTLATAGLAYCNKETADNLDFAYELHTFGCAFIAPGVRVLGQGATGVGTELITQLNTHIAHWWECVLPRHCSIELRTQQDTIIELPAMAASPGYGPSHGGGSFEWDLCGRRAPNGTVSPDYLPLMNVGMTQGVPELKNRWSLTNPETGNGVQIPRTATIEAILTVSEHARYLLNSFTFRPNYFFGGIDGNAGWPQFPARFMIQVSLLGMRFVQQRGQYHA